MECAVCEYDPRCFPLLRVSNKLARSFHILDKQLGCKQGRKRAVPPCKKIGEILDDRQEKLAEATA